MKYLFIVLAAFFLGGDCRRGYSDEGEVSTNCANKDVDKFLDDVLDKARHELEDPMRLPPRSTIVDLSDGVLWGMSELKRTGNAIVTCDGDKVTIQAKLTTDELKGRYTWTQERRGKNPREGFIVFISHDFEAEVTLVIEHKEGEVNHPQLEKFVINKFRDAKIEITGMSYFTWALGEMTTLVSGIFQRAIAHKVQEPIKEALQRKMREVNLE